MQPFDFAPDEIPFGILQEFGLSQEMVEDLPVEVLEQICKGQVSPVLPIEVKDDDGTVVRARSRFRLVRSDDGDADVVFYPRLMRCDLQAYSEEERRFLCQGRAIVGHSPDDDRVSCFVQVDPGTNQILYVPTQVIGRNLGRLADHYHLSSKEIEALQSGSPVTFEDRGEDLTACIDLTDRTGVSVILGKDIGEFMAWDTELDSYNFGIYGCWVRDDEGNLDYVHEDDYTDEIWEAQERMIARNSGMKR